MEYQLSVSSSSICSWVSFQSASPQYWARVPSSESRCDLVPGPYAEAFGLVVPGGPDSTLGMYSRSWIRPSKVRLSTRSRATSG